VASGFWQVDSAVEIWVEAKVQLQVEVGVEMQWTIMEAAVIYDIDNTPTARVVLQCRTCCYNKRR
jgi:hypothetical protein